MNVRSFKELREDMRDNRDIYPKRGSSFEEIAIVNLMDVIHYFDSIKSEIGSNLFIRDKGAYDSFTSFENFMHQKFDVVESLLKDSNIEYFERTHKEKDKNAN